MNIDPDEIVRKKVEIPSRKMLGLVDIHNVYNVMRDGATKKAVKRKAKTP